MLAADPLLLRADDEVDEERRRAAGAAAQVAADRGDADLAGEARRVGPGVQLVPFTGLIMPFCQTERRTSRLGSSARRAAGDDSSPPTSAL